MDHSAGQYKSDEKHLYHPFFNVAQLCRDFINRLAKFFTVTEEERVNAGIGTRARD
jgi:hypothetical protein